MNFIRFYTLTKREIVRFLKVWTQTLLSPIVTAVLYFAVFGGALSSQITEIEGVSYLAFIIPGLMIMQSTGNAYQNPSSSIIIAKYHGNIKDLLTSPFTAWEKTLSYLLGATVRGIMVAGVIWGIALVFVPDLFFADSWLWVFIIFTLSNAIFGIIGTLAGLWAKTFDHSAGIANFIITPMGFLGGVFYSLEMLPPLAQQISLLNPVLYMVEGARYAFFGTSSISISTIMIVLSGIFLVLLLLNWYAFHKDLGLKD